MKWHQIVGPATPVRLVVSRAVLIALCYAGLASAVPMPWRAMDACAGRSYSHTIVSCAHNHMLAPRNGASFRTTGSVARDNPRPSGFCRSMRLDLSDRPLDCGW